MAKNKNAPKIQHENASVYTDLFFMTIPLAVFATFLYGMRAMVLYVLAVVVANLCDRLVAVLRGRPFEPGELSNEAFAGMLAVLMPATVSYYVVVISVLVAVLVAKEAFGGYGAYVFHPTAVGYAVAAISWPEQVCRYPQPFTKLPLWGTDSSIALVNSTSYTLKNNGIPNINTLNLVLGNYAGPMGASALVIVLAAALYLKGRKTLPVTALIGFLLGCTVFVWVAPRVGGVPLSFPWEAKRARLTALKYELGSGATLFAGVFFLSDPYIVPKRKLSRILYGMLLGVVTMLFQYYGSYEAGVCFAMLITNCTGNWIDRQVNRLLRWKNKGGLSA